MSLVETLAGRYGALKGFFGAVFLFSIAGLGAGVFEDNARIVGWGTASSLISLLILWNVYDDQAAGKR